MRIGFVIPSLGGGGAEFATRQWARMLNDNGHSTFFYTYDPVAQTASEEHSTTHHHFPIRWALARWLILPLWLRRRARGDGLDVLVTMLTFSSLVGLAGVRLLRRSTPSLVIVEHGMTTAEARNGGAGHGDRAKHRLARILFKYCDAAVGVSHPVVADLIGTFKIDAAKAFVVPNPVVSPPALELAALPNSVSIVFVGRLTAEKRPLLFVETLAVLARRGVAVRGIVLGDGPLLDEVKEHGEVSGVPLDFRGWQQPWWNAAADADCLLVTSQFEGFGNVCVEAAAANIPTVAASSALGSGDSVVPGLTGQLVLRAEPEQLANGVTRAIRLRDVDPLYGWLSRFSVDTSTTLLLEVLERVTRGN